MPRKRLDYQIEVIKKDIKKMSHISHEQLENAIKALSTLDPKLAREVIERDQEVNELYTDLKERCVQTIALQQPVAKDLRFISIAMDVATNLERIGDYAVDIGRTVEYVLNEPPEIKETFSKEFLRLMKANGKEENLIKHMGDIARQMILKSGKLVTTGDEKGIEEIRELEEEMDRMFYEIFHKLIDSSRTDSAKIFYAMNLILTARHLERIGDHAINIANRSIYVRKGKEEFI